MRSKVGLVPLREDLVPIAKIKGPPHIEAGRGRQIPLTSQGRAFRDLTIADHHLGALGSAQE
ncbi:MAG: hypothetical protein CME06_07140 [Gemmatimonadetes bacterium]|nr:hypothetical protein [Gemmatimonadota bacterium]